MGYGENSACVCVCVRLSLFVCNGKEGRGLLHVSKLMGILAHIIRTVNHRERGGGGGGDGGAEKKRFQLMLERGSDGRDKEVEKSIVGEREGVKG